MNAVNIALTIFVTLIIIAVCVGLYFYFKNKKKRDAALIKAPIAITDVTTPFTITKYPGLALSTVGVEYTYNIWIKVTEPSPSSSPSCILHRSSAPPSNSTKPSNPSIWLRSDNSLMVRVSTAVDENSAAKLQPEIYPTYPSGGDDGAGMQYTIVNPLNSENSDNVNLSTSTCDVENLPLQRWVQITAVLWNKTLDVYINGKLVRSCILPGLPLHDKHALSNVYIGGGPDHDKNYNGHVSRMRYFNHAITAQEVMALYKKGPASVVWWWQTMRNRVRVTLDIGNDDDDAEATD
jgi:hypothetical protein